MEIIGQVGSYLEKVDSVSSPLLQSLLKNFIFLQKARDENCRRDQEASSH
jgi:hypothetical protein